MSIDEGRNAEATAGRNDGTEYPTTSTKDGDGRVRFLQSRAERSMEESKVGHWAKQGKVKPESTPPLSHLHAMFIIILQMGSRASTTATGPASASALGDGIGEETTLRAAEC